jgi:hypothetical protein
VSLNLGKSLDFELLTAAVLTDLIDNDTSRSRWITDTAKQGFSIECASQLLENYLSIIRITG